jgi:enediyne biosynthesis protein E7
MSAAATAPGPPAHWLLGHIPEFRSDLLGLLTRSALTYGDVVRFRLGPQVVHLVNHPDHVEHVLQRNARNYDKRTRSAQFIRSITGESLLTSNGETWQRERRLLQPSFHQRNIAQFAEQMTAAAQAMLTRWRPIAATGGTLDVASEMMQLTYTIVGRTLFSAEVGADADAVEESVQLLLPHIFQKLGRIFNWPDWVPTAENRRFRQALRRLDAIVYRIIAEHREKPELNDLLSMLLQARNPETGEGFTDAELRNETITLLLAGHETTANALTWTFYLLAQHPDVEARLRAEVLEVLGDRLPTLADLPRLTFTKMVIRESMRLYPPIWIIERHAIAEDVIGGFRIPTNSAVVVAPYALHRHPAFWKDAEKFDPTRFESGVPAAYIPFGAGARYCIGSEFAMMEAHLITACVVQAFRLRMVSTAPVRPLPVITLRTESGLPMSPVLW